MCKSSVWLHKDWGYYTQRNPLKTTASLTIYVVTLPIITFDKQFNFKEEKQK